MLVQAGAATLTMVKTLAASVAEVIFTIQQDLAGAQRLQGHLELEEPLRMARPTTPWSTEGDGADHRAHARGAGQMRQLQAAVHPDAGPQGAVRRPLGADMSGVDVDGPLPLSMSVAGLPSRGVGIVETAQREHLTIREVQRGSSFPGRRQLIGTAVKWPMTFRSIVREVGPTASISCRRRCPTASAGFAELRDTGTAAPRPLFQKGIRRNYGGGTLRCRTEVKGSTLPAEHVDTVVGS